MRFSQGLIHTRGILSRDVRYSQIPSITSCAGPWPAMDHAFPLPPARSSPNISLSLATPLGMSILSLILGCDRRTTVNMTSTKLCCREIRLRYPWYSRQFSGGPHSCYLSMPELQRNRFSDPTLHGMPRVIEPANSSGSLSVFFSSLSISKCSGMLLCCWCHLS